MLSVMLLAAGYGTRLRPLTDRVPKPLVPLGDRPLLAHIIDNLREQLSGFELIINAHHRADQVTQFVHQRVPNARVLVESRILGTAGGVRAAWGCFASAPVLVINADILGSPDYVRLLEAAGRSTCCLCVAPRRRGEGSVGVDAAGRVVRLRGEVFGVEVAGGDYKGTAVLGPDAIESLPDLGCLVGDWLLPRLRGGGEVRAYVDGAPWHDIGELKRYAQANWAWLGLRGLKSWVAPDAKVSAGATLNNVVVGAGASIDAPGVFENLVIWPEAHVQRSLRDAVVMDNDDVVSLANRD